MLLPTVLKLWRENYSVFGILGLVVLILVPLILLGVDYLHAGNFFLYLPSLSPLGFVLSMIITLLFLLILSIVLAEIGSIATEYLAVRPAEPENVWRHLFQLFALYSILTVAILVTAAKSRFLAPAMVVLFLLWLPFLPAVGAVIIEGVGPLEGIRKGLRALPSRAFLELFLIGIVLCFIGASLSFVPGGEILGFVWNTFVTVPLLFLYSIMVYASTNPILREYLEKT